MSESFKPWTSKRATIRKRQAELVSNFNSSKWENKSSYFLSCSTLFAHGVVNTWCHLTLGTTRTLAIKFLNGNHSRQLKKWMLNLINYNFNLMNRFDTILTLLTYSLEIITARAFPKQTDRSIESSSWLKSMSAGWAALNIFKSYLKILFCMQEMSIFENYHFKKR